MLKREFFATFTDKQVADPATTAQVQIAFSRDSGEDVDTVAEAGLAAGGSEPRPAQDYGFMYSRDLEDPDGNIVRATCSVSGSPRKPRRCVGRERVGRPPGGRA
ncbi:MAG TPA: hypothetical protein VEF89_25400 [Solirubrobacteraceae bacterium]|nr:hypothetical protein [Solirubrobacteraceae bacterium]